MLMRVALKSDILSLDKAINHFLAKKQKTFKDYVMMKIQSQEVKIQNSKTR